MKPDYPAEEQLPQLRELWKEAFDDEDAFLDTFFETAFAPDRCRCITVDGEVAAALYWFDCRCYDRPVAYLYAVATRKVFRGQGLCRALMADTEHCLSALGYGGIVLVPGQKGLFRMYEGMGYAVCSGIREFSCQKGDAPATMWAVDTEEYARLRRQYLPEGSVVQEGANLSLLAAQCSLYAGEDFLYAEGAELLGNADAAPGILAALGKNSGIFRTPGQERPFAMYRPLTDLPAPRYFGLAFD